MSSVKIYPPPWNLNGSGYIFLLKPPVGYRETDFNQQQCVHFKAIPLSVLMLVQYAQSEVGSYNELLYIPGIYISPRGLFMNIPVIFVDSEASLAGGRMNWGIPKNFARFEYGSDGIAKEFCMVRNTSGNLIFTAQMKNSAKTFPIHTALIPFAFRQFVKRTEYRFSPSGSGRASFIRSGELKGDGVNFPNLSEYKLISGFRVNPFRLTFPVPRVY
jgi:hypothetical protein